MACEGLCSGPGRGVSTTYRALLLIGLAAAGVGCSSADGQRDTSGSGAKSGIVFPVGGSGAASGVITIDPTGFTATEIGGYKLGAAIAPGGAGGAVTGTATAPDGQGCGSYILAVVRDFKGADEPGGHPDFEAFDGDDVTPDLVASTLGSDQKPVYASQCEAAQTDNDRRATAACPFEQQTTSQAAFDQWYRNVADVNSPYLVYFQFALQDGISTFQSDRFFPLDDAGWGNSGNDEDGQSRNFHFTTEVHTRFLYQGQETFRFIGDDDVWVFINGRLAVDLGGLHPSTNGEVDLDAAADALGITPGNSYSLDLFHAERHTTASHFRIDTTLTFVNCGTVVPEVY